MAGLQNFDQQVDKVNQSLEELKTTLHEVLTSTKKLDDEFSEGATDAQKLNERIKGVDKTTDQLTASQKELIRIHKASQKVTVESAKAQIQLTQKRKAARIEAEKQLGVTKKQIPFTKKMAGAFKLAAAQIVAVFIAIRGLIEAGKKYVKLVAEVNKQTAQTATTFGVTKTEAKGLTLEIRKLSTAFEKDFNDVLKSANILSKEFGISGSKALELIRSGFEKGADVNGEFLELLKEYPAQLKSVGLSAEETIAIITQTERAGIFSDKGIDAIKEAGIRLRELTPATREALEGIGLSSNEIQRSLEDGSKSLFEVTQDVSAQLAKMPPQSHKVGTAIADIFGGPGEDAGLRFLTTLKDLNLELSEIESTLSEDEKATIRLREAWEELRTQAAGSGGFLATIKNRLADLIISVVNFRNTFVTGFNDMIRSSATFRAIIKSLGVVSKGAFKIIFDSIMLTLEPIFLLGNAMDDIVAGNLKNLKNTFKEGFGDIKTRAVDIFNIFKDGGQDIAAAFRGDDIEGMLIGVIDLSDGMISATDKVLGFKTEMENVAETEKNLEDQRKKAEDAEKKRSQERLNRIKEYQGNLDLMASEEIKKNKEKLLKKEIDEETFAMNMLTIQAAFLEAEKQNKELTNEEILEIDQQLLDAQLAMSDARREKELENDEIIKEKRISNLMAIADIAAGLSDLASSLYDKQLSDLEAQKQYELELAGDNVKKREQIEKDFAQKEAKIKTKQAKAEKANALFQVAINTAVAIMSVAPIIPLMVLMGALGAIQIASIAAKPIPKFAKGVKDFEGGRAIVGEQGRELLVSPGGGVSWSPDHATQMLLPSGTDVIPHYESEKMIQGGIMPEKFDALIAETRETRKAILGRPVKETSLTDKGLRRSHHANNSRTEWLDIYIRS